MAIPQGIPNQNTPNPFFDAFKEMLKGKADQYIDASVPVITDVTRDIIEESGRSSAQATQGTAEISPEIAPELQETAQKVREGAQFVAGQVNEECMRPIVEESKVVSHAAIDASVDTTAYFGDATTKFFGGE